MRLFIAEKPELAKAIVEGLGGGTRRGGYYDCGNDYVTWCFGHMLQLLDPEDYDPRYKVWNMEDLPIAHIPWRKKPGGDKDEQLKIIIDLLARADSVVHAGDPDDEGQLLVDEILQYVDCRLPVQRVLINDNTTKLVRKALDSMRDNSEFAGASAGAEARSVGDQLYGYNLTRAYTLAAREAGYQGLLSVGRVQTAIVGLVVRRDRENASHTKAYYYNVGATFQFGDVTFPARYQVVDGDPVDDKNRLVSSALAEQIAASAKGQPARIIAADTKSKDQHPPLPYNLLKLQVDASRKYGFKPDQTKEITQSLREKHKLITYNRSDCEYLSDEQHAAAPAVLAAIAATAPMMAPITQRADPTIKSRAFNSTKVSAHHGIIPTEESAAIASLSDGEQKIYLLIARAYAAQFWPKHEYDQTNITVAVGQHEFKVRANITTAAGWRTLFKADAGNEDLEGDEDDIAVDIRSVVTGATGDCTDAVAAQMETKPRPLYTMATLLSDLTRVAKYVRDERLRKLLLEKDKGKEGEHGGIGTPATRDTMIATLFERSFLVESGKNIVSTPTAREFYDILPDQAKYPDMTALWHEQQKAIQAGERDVRSFIDELMQYIAGEVESIKTNGIGMKFQIFPCPQCKKPMRRVKHKDKESYFWGCSGFNAEDPTACKYLCDDRAGRPVPRIGATVSTQFKCTVCQHGLSRKPAKRGGFWWGCSNFPTCKEKYPDLKGRPQYPQKTPVKS